MPKEGYNSINVKEGTKESFEEARKNATDLGTVSQDEFVQELLELWDDE